MLKHCHVLQRLMARRAVVHLRGGGGRDHPKCWMGFAVGTDPVANEQRATSASSGVYRSAGAELGMSTGTSEAESMPRKDFQRIWVGAHSNSFPK